MKKIHYLSGLPRSGNTVLSALLNQNPNVYSSPISPMSDVLYKMEIEYSLNEGFIRTPNTVGINNVLKNVIPNYYAHIEKDVIFDREKNWITPNNFNRLKKFVNPNPKVIFTVRNTLDILKSFILQSNNHGFLEEGMHFNDYLPSYYLEKNDAICDYIMQSDVLIGKSLVALYNGLTPENRKFVHYIEYDDLVENPETTMKKLYYFLELDYFSHDFNNMMAFELSNESAVNLPQTLHQVHPILKHYSPPVEEVLSPYIIQKYKNADIWRKML